MKLLCSFLQACIGVVTVWLLLLHAADAVSLSLLQILMPAAGLGLLISVWSAVDLSIAAFVLFVRLVERHDNRKQLAAKRATRLRKAVLFICCCGLSVSAIAMEKPVLLVIHSDQCAPCRVFDRVYLIDQDLRTALQRGFDVRELDLGVPSQRLEAAKYGVKDVPTFLVLRGGKVVSSHRGFSPTMEVGAVNRAIEDLMDDLQVEWPLQVDPPKKAPAAAPRVEPKPIASTSHPGPTIDQQARDGLTKLATQTRSLQDAQQKTQSQVEEIASDVRQFREEVNKSDASLRSQIEASSTAVRDLRSDLTRSNTESRTHLETVSQTLQKSIESSRSSTREELQTIIRDRISKERPDISTEIPATSSKWVSMFGTLGKIALTVAAPEIAIPGSLGLTALGFGLSWLKRRRRKQVALPAVKETTRVVPIAVDAPIPPAKIQTETRFVAVDRDTHQQAHAWAKEQLARRYPGATPTLETLDSLIAQYLEGRKDKP